MDNKNENASLNTSAESMASKRLPQVVLISGPLHSGKTSLASRISQRLHNQGYRVSGILAPGSWKNGVRTGFDLNVLQTGKTFFLAERCSMPPHHSPNTVPFRFDEAAINAGRDALHPDICRDFDVIFVDEVGRLELKGLGWAPCLQPLLDLPDKLHIWIVRETLVESVCEIWNIRPLSVVNAARPDAEDTLWQICRRTLC